MAQPQEGLASYGPQWRNRARELRNTVSDESVCLSVSTSVSTGGGKTTEKRRRTTDKLVPLTAKQREMSIYLAPSLQLKR